jgi:hypothetical protein
MFGSLSKKLYISFVGLREIITIKTLNHEQRIKKPIRIIKSL